MGRFVLPGNMKGVSGLDLMPIPIGAGVGIAGKVIPSLLARFLGKTHWIWGELKAVDLGFRFWKSGAGSAGESLLIKIQIATAKRLGIAFRVGPVKNASGDVVAAAADAFVTPGQLAGALKKLTAEEWKILLQSGPQRAGDAMFRQDLFHLAMQYKEGQASLGGYKVLESVPKFMELAR